MASSNHTPFHQVDPNLFYLVFGESVINDAVGVVLFNTVAKFVGNPGGAGPS